MVNYDIMLSDHLLSQKFKLIEKSKYNHLINILIFNFYKTVIIKLK
jgi:hypothetical protein